jgi:hypothetical protein
VHRAKSKSSGAESVRLGVFLDTTMLADATLGVREVRNKTLAALSKCPRRAFPQYAAKEFKAGPLAGYVLFNNILAQERSLEGTLARLHALSGTPRRNLIRTAIQAYRRAVQEASAAPGRQATQDEWAEDYRAHTKRVIFSAWRSALALGEMTDALECHRLSAPREDGPRLIELDDRTCHRTGCALAKRFHNRKQEIAVLVRVIDGEPAKEENINRRAALEKLLADQNLTDSECRHLGDAVFALLAPQNFAILTTNLRDHRPLAQALGKEAISPDEVM